MSKYAILTRSTKLRVCVDEDIGGIKGWSLLDDEESERMEEGTLLKVIKTTTNATESKYVTVQVLDLVQHNPIYEGNVFACPHTHLRKVSEDVWPYVISIAQPERRLQLISNTNKCNWIMYLKLNDIVSVTGELFGAKNSVYYCIIRYIGPVHELHAVGHFFGLELLNLDNGFSPQSEAVPFAIKYMQCDPSLSIFTTADWLAPLSNPAEAKKKFSALELLSGTLGKVVNAIGPNGCGLGSDENKSINNDNNINIKKKIREPTARFYDNSDFIHITHDMAHSSSSCSSGNGNNSNKNNNNNNNNVTLIDVTDKMDVKIEKQQQELLVEVSPPPPPPPAPAIVPPLTGILKHTTTSSATNNNPTRTTNITATKKNDNTSISADDLCNNKAKVSSTLFNLEHKNIIIIDQDDIDECTRNEHNIIVVDKGNNKKINAKNKQEEVDLAELLGGNWPNTAGDAAVILNKTRQKSTASNTNNNNNNKSATISAKRTNLSHTTERRAERSKTVIVPPQAEDTRADPNIDSENNTPDSLLPTEPENYGHVTETLRSRLGVGSMVEVNVPEVSEDLYGVVRWAGIPPGGKHILVGVELENVAHCGRLRPSNGTYNGYTLFNCQEPRAIFVPPNCCTIDRRFIESEGSGAKAHIDVANEGNKMFGQIECPSVPGAVAPLKIYNLEELNALCGKFKGIQGHHNSCYLDATLFSMFTFTSVFDSLLFRPPDQEDISNYVEVQTVLREEIVNPLRKNMFVRADRVMKLRQLLDKLSSVSGLTSEEKDPEEFLNSLLSQIMRVEPFLKLSSGQDAYFYQLFVEKDERLCFPTVQQLFEQSFHSSDIKLKEVPSCLIIQMPRFGKNYKMYPRILPSQVLDVTDIIEDSPRQCSVCGKLAEYECRDCFGILQGEMDLESTAFCRKCLETVHMHAKRSNHTWKKFSVPQDFKMMAEHMAVPRLYMELFAVVCIETSHYVAFVKAASGPDAPWCFFDSMADRKGEQNGYNIPEMLTVPDLPEWLSEEGAHMMNETTSNDKMLPEHAKRIFCDAYMCMYQSTDVMMYR